MAMRNGDCACRMGGDEFAAELLFGMDTTDAAMRERAQQIFDEVSITLKGVEGGTGISMGAAIAGQGATFSQLYEISDTALYQAKANGRGRLVIHQSAS